LFHRAAKIDHDLAVSLLEIDQSRQHPEIAGSFGHRDAHRTPGVGRKRGAAENVEAQALHLLDVEQQSPPFIAQ